MVKIRSAHTASPDTGMVMASRRPLASRTPAGVRWTYLFGALGGLLFGYDTGVIGGALLFIRQEMHLGPLLQGIVVSSLLVGAMIGAGACSRLSDRFGPRRLLMAAGVLLAAGSLGAASAPDAQVLTAFRVVIGIGVGVASVQVPIYLSEIAPTSIRGALSTLNQIMISGGVFTAYLVNFLLAGHAAWRLMIGLAVFPALLLTAGMWRQPESPRWLFRQGRIAEATDVLRRNRSAEEADGELAGMQAASHRIEPGLIPTPDEVDSPAGDSQAARTLTRCSARASRQGVCYGGASGGDAAGFDCGGATFGLVQVHGWCAGSSSAGAGDGAGWKAA